MKRPSDFSESVGDNDNQIHTVNPIVRDSQASYGDIETHSLRTTDFEMCSIKKGVIGDDDKKKNDKTAEQNKSDRIADLIVKSITPNGVNNLSGRWAWGLIWWILFWDVFVFGILMIYFLLLSCEGKSSVIAINLKDQVYSNTFKSFDQGTYPCMSFLWKIEVESYSSNTQIVTNPVPCNLPGFSCDDYVKPNHYNRFFGIYQKCHAIGGQDVTVDDSINVRWQCGTSNTDDNINPPIDCFDYYDLNLNALETAAVSYLQCTAPTTAFTNSVQYTLYLQLVIYLLYMAVWIVGNKGWKQLFVRKTWFKLIFSSVGVDEAIMSFHEDRNA